MFLFLRVFLFVVFVPLLARLKINTLQRILEPTHPSLHPDHAKIAQIRYFVDGAFQVGAPFVRSTCLTRTLTLYYFLRRAGVELTISFGMGMIEDEFAGHCWLVKDGEPFLEAKDPGALFTEMFRIPQVFPAEKDLGQFRLW